MGLLFRWVGVDGWGYRWASGVAKGIFSPFTPMPGPRADTIMQTCKTFMY